MLENISLDDHLVGKSFILKDKIRNIWFKFASTVLATAFLILCGIMFFIVYYHIDDPDDTQETYFLIEDIVYTLFLILPLVVIFYRRYIVQKIKYLENKKEIIIYNQNKFAFYSSHFVLICSIVTNLLTLIIPIFKNELTFENWEDFTLCIFIIFYTSSLFFFYFKIFKYLPILTCIKKDKI